MMLERREMDLVETAEFCHLTLAEKALSFTHEFSFYSFFIFLSIHRAQQPRSG